MKVYPARQVVEKVKIADKELSATERVTKVIALIVAFGTVAFYFFKILFL